MGVVFYEMGLLATDDVFERSASDLIGEYVGQTGPKTKKLLTSALGRVLFIDEAYMLNQSSFGKEAIIEMVNTLTHNQFRNQLVTILAGYEDDINTLIGSNPGVASRFPVIINFNHLSVPSCVNLLLQCLHTRELDTSALKASSHVSNVLKASFERLISLPSWGNARDIQTLSKAIYMRIMGVRTSQISLVVHEKTVIEEIEVMITERCTRVSAARHSQRDWDSTPGSSAPREDAKESPLPPPPQFHTSIEKKDKIIHDHSSPELRSKIAPKETDVTVENGQEASIMTAGQANALTSTPYSNFLVDVARDPDISDEVWSQLQLDKQAARQRQTQLNALRQMVSSLAQQEKEARRRIAEGTEVELWNGRLEDFLRKHATYSRELKRGEDEAREEKKIQGLLSGVCPYGFTWTRQADGWRCAGGAHFVGWGQLAQGDVGDAFEDPWSAILKTGLPSSFMNEW